MPQPPSAPTGTAVACCQVAPVLGDPAANRELVAQAVTDAARLGAHVVVLPELVSSGYAFEDRSEALASAETTTGPTITLWQRLADQHELVLVGGFCEVDSNGSVRNSSAIVDPTGLRAVYHKAHLWDAERLIFEPGDAPPPVVDTFVGRVSTVICYDLEFPEWVRLPALAGALLLCAPVNWPSYPRPEGERPAEVVRVQANAAVNRMYIAACDRTGREREIDWVGGSVVVDADGWPLGGGEPRNEARTVVGDCHLETAEDKDVGGLSNIHADRRPRLYHGVVDPTIAPARVREVRSRGSEML